MDFTKKIKHIRSSSTCYKVKVAEQYYGTNDTRFFFEPLYQNYDGYQVEDDFVPDRIVDRFGRRILSLS